MDDSLDISDIDNLLLNMSAGLEPKDLSYDDEKLLEREFGRDWEHKLGYQSNLEYLEAKLLEKERKNK